MTSNIYSGIDTGTWLPGQLFHRELQSRLHVPETLPVNRAQWLTLSFWEDVGDGFLPLKIGFSDYPLLGDTLIILDELVMQDLTLPAREDEPLASFANGFALHPAVLPPQARTGSEISLNFHWSSASAGREDWTRFLHFFHEETGHSWTVDRYPLGLRLPTRLWYAGLHSSEQWRFLIPENLEPGNYSVHTGLYRLADMERLNVTLTDGSRPADNSIPLGTIFIEG